MLSKREKVLVAVLGSILLHGLILLLFGVGLHYRPPVVEAARAEPPKPIALEIQHEDPPEVFPTNPLVPTPPPMVENKDTNAPAPANPAFESNENSTAASEKAGTGDAPLPTVEGKKIPDFTFASQTFTVGDKPAVNASAPSPPSPQEPSPPDRNEPPQPTQPPVARTEPPRPTVDRTAPRTRPTPVPTPEPIIERDVFAMLGPTPTPRPEPQADDNYFDPTRREPQTEPRRPTPAVSRPPTSQPGYQPMTQAASMSGSISNRGPAAVAALGTPMGRYKKAITDAIGSRWYYYMGQRADVASFGTVKIHFVIDRSGATRQQRVVSNTGNSTLEGVSIQAIQEATIPPMPPEVSEIVNSNQLEFDFSFSLVDF